MATAIPRFLLPQRSSIWRSTSLAPSRAIQSIRNASHKAPPKSSSKTPPKTPVLEKPTRFNPPSHGSRLPKDRPRYSGPPLSSAQIHAQKTKKYPNMMPPEGSFLHWFLNNRSIHLYITLGTLFSLAGYASITHFTRTSPFAAMLPQASDLFFHPISFIRTCLEVLKLHTAHVSAETAERRKRVVEDVQKRGEYRKKHGLESEGFGGWTAKTDGEVLGPTVPTGNEGLVVVVAAAAESGGEESVRSGDEGERAQLPKKPLRKWLGIW